jgi:hypothetical protein
MAHTIIKRNKESKPATERIWKIRYLTGKFVSLKQMTVLLSWSIWDHLTT